MALCTGALGKVHGCTSGRGKKKRRSWYTLSSYTAKDNKNDMGKYTTDPLQTGREIEKADALGTLSGEFGPCWNGSYRYRHFDNLSGDAVTAELFGIRRLMSCDSVRRNLKAIPMEAGSSGSGTRTCASSSPCWTRTTSSTWTRR